jgi:hypothetical protein
MSLVRSEYTFSFIEQIIFCSNLTVMAMSKTWIKKKKAEIMRSK